MPETETKPVNELRQRRYRQAAALLNKWSNEDREYDERVGSALEKEMPANRMQCEESDENPS